jgi:hypothetical protein
METVALGRPFFVYGLPFYVLLQPMNWLLVFFFCLLATNAGAQFNGALPAPKNLEPDTVWIITGKRELGPAYKRYKLDFAIDARQTIIGSQRTKIGGIRVGLEYRRVHRVGIGFYGLRDGILNGISGAVELDGLPQIDSTITWAKLTMSYRSLYYERVMYFSRKLEWSLTTHYGFGKISGSYTRLGSPNLETLPAQRLQVLEFSSLCYYNLTYWCSIGVGIGYRYVPAASKEIREVYEAPIGLLRVRIKPGKLISSLWDKNAKYLY